MTSIQKIQTPRRYQPKRCHGELARIIFDANTVGRRLEIS